MFLGVFVLEGFEVPEGIWSSQNPCGNEFEQSSGFESRNSVAKSDYLMPISKPPSCVWFKG